MLLCEDGVWGVRKACIECFVNVASTCSLQVRRDDLIPVFLSLLNDQSRWVSKLLSYVLKQSVWPVYVVERA